MKELRIQSGLTQKALAEKLGVSPTGYAGYEQGYREPDFKTLVKICKTFKECPASFWGWKATREKNKKKKKGGRR